MSTRISEENLGSRRGAEAQRAWARGALTAKFDGRIDEKEGRWRGPTFPSPRLRASPSPRLRASARTFFFLTPLLLAAACGSTRNGNAEAADDSGNIACAPQGASDFKRACTLDRVAGDDGLSLVVHNPDGGFHRLLVTKDGRGVVAADGAEKATVTITGPGEIEVAIGGDRYRLPATVKGQAPS
jgi:hypothetical protein